MIVTVGSIALDTIETPRGFVDDMIGGSATFVCGAASKLAPVSLIGIVGTDFPQVYQDLFAGWNVNTEGLEKVEGKTFRWRGRYHEDMIHRDTLSTELGVFGSFQPKVPPSLRSSSFLALGNIHPAQQQALIDQVDRPRWIIADTMKLWIDTARDCLEQMIGRVNTLVINDEEARNLTGEISLTAAAKVLMAKGPSSVIVKRGEHGASLHSNQGIFYCPAYPLEAVEDTTGAGDSFLGGVIGWLAKTGRTDFETLKQAVQVGTCMASFTVESFGVQSLDRARLADVQTRLDQLNRMTQVGPVILQ